MLLKSSQAASSSDRLRFGTPVTNAFCSCPLKPVAQGFTVTTLLLRQTRMLTVMISTNNDPAIIPVKIWTLRLLLFLLLPPIRPGDGAEGRGGTLRERDGAGARTGGFARAGGRGVGAGAGAGGFVGDGDGELGEAANGNGGFEGDNGDGDEAKDDEGGNEKNEGDGDCEENDGAGDNRLLPFMLE